MTARKKPVTVGVDDVADQSIDLPFDDWDEAAEELAIQAVAAAADVKCIIVERTLAGRFPDGTIVRAPLDISVADLDAITAEADNPVDQVKVLFERIGDAESAAILESQGLTSAVIFASKFFETFEKVSKAALGKYLA